MKKIELQKKLDKRKYLESERQGKDLSGFMNYCEYCVMQLKDFQITTENNKPVFTIISVGCSKSPELREKYNLCAKAYIKRDHEKRRKK